MELDLDNKVIDVIHEGGGMKDMVFVSEITELV